ncbi:very low-density lipoprotein receptor-like [Physella acuta]|uniref:very low-density lipoprotein receptor-like n=1 Tax=Physella acuta TaxID=109671 RepID=UPI0027DE9016|nr:very low-density lipoprotein receptor-like [Physella acuta]
MFVKQLTIALLVFAVYVNAGELSSVGDNVKRATNCSPPYDFYCDGRKCLPQAFVCNGLDDCDDLSDEANCPPNCSGPKMFRCADGDLCVARYDRCNGQNDCLDASDEDDCPTECSPDDFKCDRGTCLPHDFLCNGWNDCDDHSDEANCPPNCSGPKMFKCSSGDECVPRFTRCDFENDCHDKSDEANCP